MLESGARVCPEANGPGSSSWGFVVSSTTERGYGADHQRERERWAPVVEAGEASCVAIVCLEQSRWLDPTQPWDLGHNAARTGWTGPEHIRCNRSEGATRGNRQRRRRGSQDW